jgi:hypothetical protein
LKTAAHPRYQLEVGLVKLMEMRRLESLNQLLERLSVLEASVRAGKPAPGISPGTKAHSSATSGISTSPVDRSRSAALPPTPPGKSKTAVSSSAASGSGSFAGAATKTALETEARDLTVENSWHDAEEGTSAVADRSEIEQIKAALEKRRKMFLVTALEGARHASLEGNELCLEFAPGARHLRDTLAKSENVKILREVCKEITTRDVGVRFVIADGEAAGAPISREETERREQQSLLETAEKDPTVQQMLRTFRGEIIDVKRVDGKS